MVATFSISKQRVPSSATDAGIVFDVKRFAIHDGPGIRTTVFLKGCPMTCRWCHNPESQRAEPELLFWEDRCTGCTACVTACPVHAVRIVDGTARTDRSRCTACGACIAVCRAGAREMIGRRRTVEEILAEVERDVLFYDQSGGGMTLSGGEPLAQPDFAIALLRTARERRIHTAVDTCGYADESAVRAVAPLADLFLYDVKRIDEEQHRRMTGVSNAPVLANARLLDRLNRRIWLRYPLIPSVNDSQDEVAAVGEFANSLANLEAIHVLPYHRAGEEKLARLERSGGLSVPATDARDAAERAAEILRRTTDRPVHIGG